MLGCKAIARDVGDLAGTSRPVQQRGTATRRITAVLGRRPQTSYAAPFGHEQGHVGSLHPDGVLRPSQIERSRAHRGHMSIEYRMKR